MSFRVCKNCYARISDGVGESTRGEEVPKINGTDICMECQKARKMGWFGIFRGRKED